MNISEIKKRLSFGTKIIIVTEFLVIITALICGFFVHKNIHTLVREILRNKLMSTASTAANILDYNLVDSINNPSDKESENYAIVKNILKQTALSDESIDSVYILEKTDRENILRFLADSAETEDLDGNGTIEDIEKAAELGEEFDLTPFPEMERSFYEKSADREIACDRWGCWLSGYAPIINDKNETIAIIGVDISAEQIIAYEGKLKFSLLLTLGLIIIFFPILLFFYLRRALRPITEIADDITKFSGDLSTRIEIGRKDEIGKIAENFNKMADELSDLVHNMESKVAERTREIESQRKHIEMEKNKTESILKSIGDGVFVIDTNLKITMFNKIAESITGFSTDEVLGRKYYEKLKFVSDIDETKSNDQFIKEAIRTGQTKEMPFHTILISKHHQKIPVADSASPLKNKKGEVIGCVIVFRDITHEYEIDKAKTEFVSLASHQLRTPLSSINWYVEMLLNDSSKKITPKQKEYLREIYEGNQRMIDLINSLLNVSRIEMGTFLVEPQETDILAMANDVIRELTPKSSEKNIVIQKNYDQKMPKINVDPKLMRIVFQNLLSNSLKYTEHSGKIELKISRDSKNLFIEVSDNGLGIPENQKANIFSKFFRADNVRQTKTEGTGLGLYLLKSIIDHCEGTISFSSQENQGTTFQVSIPLKGMKAKKGTKEIIEINSKIDK